MQTTLEQLWDDAPPATATFDPAAITHLPPAAQRYLLHAIAPGTPLSTAARVEMNGEIRLGDTWSPFSAVQVVRWDRGFVWRARTRMHGLPVSGADRWVDGAGAMRWKLLGVVPVMTAEGADITRSAAGRLHSEVAWLPAVLLSDDVRWSTDDDGGVVRAVLTAHGETSPLELTLAEDGALTGIRIRRWGNVDSHTFHYADFGGSTEADQSFGGFTVPTRYRVGWYYGTDRFVGEGEFFRCTLGDVQYR